MRGLVPSFLHASLFTMLTAIASFSAFGQTYPSRPLKIEVGFPSASTVDIVARAVAQKLNDAWSQPVIVENKPGGARVNVLHVPYKGSSQVLVDVATGDVAMSFSGMPPALPLIQRHKVKALGVTSAVRSDAMPNVPTFRESGVSNFEVGFWYGAFAPAKTPPDIVAKLNGEVDRALKSQDLRRHFVTLGLDPVGGSASDFERFLKTEIDRWSKVVQVNGLVLEE